MYIFEYYKNEIASMTGHDSSRVKFWWNRHDNITEPYIVYQTEDLIHSHKRDDQYMRFLSNAEKVYDYSTVNLKYHSGEFRPYMPNLHSNTYDGYKDIDVLFYGGMSERRREIINRLSSQYSITYIEQFKTLDEHIDAIRRSNYVLSIGYYDNNYNDFWRVTPALDFGANIMLELNNEIWSIDYLQTHFKKRIKFI